MSATGSRAIEWLLLADRSPFHSMSRNFRGRHAQLDTDDIIMVVLIVVGAALGIWILSRLMQRQDKEKRYHNRRALFRALCRAHGLSYRQRWLLSQHARRLQLDEPGRLFLEPQHLEPAAMSGLETSQAVELSKLRAYFFAGLE